MLNELGIDESLNGAMSCVAKRPQEGSQPRSGWKLPIEPSVPQGTPEIMPHNVTLQPDCFLERWGKAVEGHRTPRRWRESRYAEPTRNVLDCASPLALFAKTFDRNYRICHRDRGRRAIQQSPVHCRPRPCQPLPSLLTDNF
jgi:hypothetical protein